MTNESYVVGTVREIKGTNVVIRLLITLTNDLFL